MFQMSVVCRVKDTREHDRLPFWHHIWHQYSAILRDNLNGRCLSWLTVEMQRDSTTKSSSLGLVQSNIKWFSWL